MNNKIWMIAGGAAMLVSFIAAGKAWAGEPYCREYTKTITIGGIVQQGYGTTCYKPDGSWEISDLQGTEAAQDAVVQTVYYDVNQNVPQPQVVYVNRYVTQVPQTRVVYVNNNSYKRYDHRWNNQRPVNYWFNWDNDRGGHHHDNRYNNGHRH